jgi:hypothetical protein
MRLLAPMLFATNRYGLEFQFCTKDTAIHGLVLHRHNRSAAGLGK